MAKLKRITNQNTTSGSNNEDTKCKKIVTGAKFKKGQDAITAMRPYADKLTELLQSVSASLEGDSGSVFAEQRDVKNVLVVAITSNRGLCGAFNTNVIKQASKLANETYADKNVSFMTVGKKGNDILSKKYYVIHNNNSVFDDLTFENASDITRRLMEVYTEGTYDKILLVYNHFKNAATQIVK